MMRADDRNQMKQALVGYLDQHPGGRLPTATLRAIATGFGVSEQTVRRESYTVTAMLDARRLADLAAAQVTPDVVLSKAAQADEMTDLLTEVDLTSAPLPVDWWASTDGKDAVLAALGGSPSVKHAHTALTDQGVVAVCYPQFTRQLRSHLSPAVHGALTAYGNQKGREGFLRHSLYVVDRAPYRNARWQADCQEIPMRVRPMFGTTPLRCWQITFLDEATRLVMGSTIVEGRPTGNDVLATLAIAIRGTTNHNGIWIGGIPELIRWDNGKEFLNAAMTNACARLGIAPDPSLPYSGFQKGKIERWQGVSQEDLYSRLPGAVHGPKTYQGRRPWVGPDRDLLSTPSLRVLSAEWIYEKNNERRHRSLPGTPIEAWCDDPTPVRQAAAELLYPLMLELPRKRTVNKNGVSYGDVYYSDPALKDWRGRKVHIRVLPDDEDFVYVFDPKTDEHICDAIRAENLTPEQRRTILMQRNEDYREVRRALNAGNALRADDALLDRVREAEIDFTADDDLRAHDADDPDDESIADEPPITAPQDVAEPKTTKSITTKTTKTATSTNRSGRSAARDLFTNLMGDD